MSGSNLVEGYPLPALKTITPPLSHLALYIIMLSFTIDH